MDFVILCIIQLAAMLASLLIIGAIIGVGITFGWFWGLVAAIIMYKASEDTGGILYPWRPSSIKKFFHNGKEMLSNEQNSGSN